MLIDAGFVMHHTCSVCVMKCAHMSTNHAPDHAPGHAQNSTDGEGLGYPACLHWKDSAAPVTIGVWRESLQLCQSLLMGQEVCEELTIVGGEVRSTQDQGQEHEEMPEVKLAWHLHELPQEGHLPPEEATKAHQEGTRPLQNTGRIGYGETQGWAQGARVGSEVLQRQGWLCE